MKAAFLAGLCLIGTAAGAYAAPDPRHYSVERYEAWIAPDVERQRLNGAVSIHYRSRGSGMLYQVELDAGPALEVDEVLDGKTRLQFERRGALLFVALATPATQGQSRTLTVRYHAGPGKGLKFYPGQVYSEFFTNDWMVCNDRPEDRATLLLKITIPKGLRATAGGEPTGEDEWRIDTPTPPFLYGFAIGQWQETSDASGDSPRLRLLGSPEVLQSGRAILNSTRSALQFFADKTGKDYPASVYTQVFTHGSPMQENAGLTLLPESYGSGLWTKPDDLWLLAHELAHQWYAVGIPCQDWSDFWLNEGMATFLADAFLEHRFGRPRYEREIGQSRAIYERMKSEGKDRALSFHAWDTTKEAGGQIPYHKGAYALDLLRREMGDDKFWRGLQIYTRDNWNKPVTSREFQKAMESAYRKSLAGFFDEWVYRP